MWTSPQHVAGSSAGEHLVDIEGVTGSTNRGNLAALSLHPKIPFLADKVGGDRNIAFAVREPAFGTGKIVVFGDVALLLRIETKRFELSATGHLGDRMLRLSDRT